MLIGMGCSWVAVTIFVLTALAAGVEVAGQVLVVPTQRECEAVAEAMEPLDFVKSALGGDFTCLSSPGEDSTCCEKIRGLFGMKGKAQTCLCNPHFFSTFMMTVPPAMDVDPESYVGLLSRCGVPAMGSSLCPGSESEADIEPLVQSQVIGSLVLRRIVSSATRSQRPPNPPPRPPRPPPPRSPRPPTSPPSSTAPGTIILLTVDPPPAIVPPPTLPPLVFPPTLPPVIPPPPIIPPPPVFPPTPLPPKQTGSPINFG